MKVGNLKLVLILFFIFSALANLKAEENPNLNIIQPTFEEEIETEKSTGEISSKIKSKQKLPKLHNDSVVKFRALDKITAKTKDIEIVIGKKRGSGI